MEKMAQQRQWHQLSNGIAKAFFVLTIISHLFPLAESKCLEDMPEMDIKSPYAHKIKYGIIKCNVNKEELHFLHLGDTGGVEFKNAEGKTDYKPTVAQWAVAMNMRALVADELQQRAASSTDHHSQQQQQLPSLPFQPDFAINAGDNFYEHGLNDDDHFEKVFLNVYNRPPPAASPAELGPKPKNPLAIPWYTILGNNDCKMLDEKKKAIVDKYANKMKQMYNKIFLSNRRRAAKQIKYKHKKYTEESSIWKMPSEYYVVEYNFGKNHSKKAVFIMLQTVLLCGPSRKDFFDKPANLKKREQQIHMEWLLGVLEDYHKEGKKPDFLFIVGHYPLYVTKGERAFPHTEELHTLFHRYQITAYLAGHEHGLKHVEIAKAADNEKENLPDAHTLHVIVSGAAAEMEECMYPKHISDMGKYVKICYPNGITTAAGTTAKSVQDGGAFITVRLKATTAEFEFWAAGGPIHPFINTAQTDEPIKLTANFSQQELLHYLPTDLEIKELHRQKIATLNITARRLKDDSSSSHGQSTMTRPSDKKPEEIDIDDGHPRSN